MGRKRILNIKKNPQNLIRAFGLNEYGLIDFPAKISGTTVSRLLVGDFMGCDRCFPHGQETLNSRYHNWQRTWKKHRKTQWKNK